eukprot:TRINITY_DN5881_c0_g1_i3.p1 TRINITY_DN5881_c0_g1~~TRINITY_DN5881_c0_g1_i3.p1  ORF type:complete len:116 (-),score=6.35 TRINITY_DN5881_c0_g1_i3:547-894(-)
MFSHVAKSTTTLVHLISWKKRRQKRNDIPDKNPGRENDNCNNTESLFCAYGRCTEHKLEHLLDISRILILHPIKPQETKPTLYRRLNSNHKPYRKTLITALFLSLNVYLQNEHSG